MANIPYWTQYTQDRGLTPKYQYDYQGGPIGTGPSNTPPPQATPALPTAPTGPAPAVNTNATTFGGYYGFDARFARWKDMIGNPETRAQGLAGYRAELDSLPHPDNVEIAPTNLNINGNTSHFNIHNNPAGNPLLANRNQPPNFNRPINGIFADRTNTTNLFNRNPSTTNTSTGTNPLFNNRPNFTNNQTGNTTGGNGANPLFNTANRTPTAIGNPNTGSTGTSGRQNFLNSGGAGLTAERNQGTPTEQNYAKSGSADGGPPAPTDSVNSPLPTTNNPNGRANWMGSGGTAPTNPGEPTQPPNQQNYFRFDRSRPIEEQVTQFLNGRDPYGTQRNWHSIHNRPDLYDLELRSDESGTQYINNVTSKHPRLFANGAGNVVVDGKYVPVPYANGKIDDVVDENKVFYDPEFGFLTTPDNMRDPDKRRDMWLAVLGFAGVVGPAVGGILGAEGVWLANNPFYNASLGGPGGVGATAGATSGIAATPPPAAGTPAGFEQMWNGVKQIWDGTKWVRYANTAFNLYNSLTNRGQQGGNRMSGSGNDDDWLNGIGHAIRGGINAYQDNRNIQEFKNQQNDLFNRGDYNREYRPGYLSRLNQFMMNPEASLQDPTYKATRDRGLEDLSRKLNARGFNMSGNEMGELQKFGQEMDYKHINDERSALIKAATLGDPSGMAAAGMRNLPFLFQARADRNSDVNGLLNGPLGNMIRQYGGQAMNWLKGLGNGQLTMDDIPPEFAEMIADTAEQYGMEVDEYVDYILQANADDLVDTTLGEIGDYGSDIDWWEWIFG